MSIQKSKKLLSLVLCFVFIFVALGQTVLATSNDLQAAWDGNFKNYIIGDIVSYNGDTYTCLQSHTSQPTWNPVDAVSLWKLDAQIIKSATYSEYDLLQSILKKSDEELLSRGMEKSEIEKLRKLDYFAELKKRAQLSDEQLNNMGYNSNQVSEMKVYANNVNPTRVEQARLVSRGSPTVTMYFLEDYHRYTGTGTSAYSDCAVRLMWEWSSCPVFLMTDIVAVAWTNGMYSSSSMNQNYCTLTYVNQANNSYYKTVQLNPNIKLNTGAYVSFRQGETIQTGWNNSFTYYCKRGEMRLYVFKHERIYDLSFNGEYGHTYVSWTPSVNLTVSGPEVGISFSTGTAEEARTDKYIRFY